MSRYRIIGKGKSQEISQIFHESARIVGMIYQGDQDISGDFEYSRAYILFSGKDAVRVSLKTRKKVGDIPIWTEGKTKKPSRRLEKIAGNFEIDLYPQEHGSRDDDELGKGTLDQLYYHLKTRIIRRFPENDVSFFRFVNHLGDLYSNDSRRLSIL